MRMNKWLACALVTLTSGCPDIKTDPDETAADPVVEFDPSRSVVPFPNNLLINQADGKVNVPPGCNESAASKGTREGVLNKLDGFGTFETAMSITLTKPVDMASLTADNVLLFKVTQDPSTSMPIPVVLRPSMTIRYANQTKNADNTLTCDTPNPVDSLVIIPRIPLDQKSTYIVALKTGIKSADGADFVPSFTWSLVRQQENPVTLDDAGNVISDRTPLDPTTETGLASLKGIDLLWKAHNPVLAFLGAKGIDRNDVLLGWSFKTQTVQDALDRTVAGTPLTLLNDVAVTGPADAVPVPLSIGQAGGVQMFRDMGMFPYEICDTGAGATAPAEPNNARCFLKVNLGFSALSAATMTSITSCNDATLCGQVFAAGTAFCQIAGCANVGDILVGRVRSPQFQSEGANTAVPAKPVPGPWADPIKPTKVKDEQLNAFIVIPAAAAPLAGYPTALFQHGLGQSSSNLFAIGGNLAGAGFASIAINAVAHGDRRVQNNNTATGCTPSPLGAQCFAGFLSPDLGATRDNIRQTVVDHNQVLASLKKCTGATCGTLVVDPAHIVYIGQSLGGILGGVTTVSNPDIKASVLNVPGVGWADIFENTQTLDIRCTLVDGLIDGGILMGDKRDTKNTPTPADDTGLCTTDAWKTQPGYAQFSAIGRWVLDPADPANFSTRLVGGMPSRKFLIQMVMGDAVVPNIATQNLAALTGRMASQARKNASLAATPSDGITMTMPASKFYIYTSSPPDAATMFPGNTYGHGSLLSPSASVAGGQCNPATGASCDGVLATVQMATDAITYLNVNK
jgi:dienelactone hydrolase